MIFYRPTDGDVDSSPILSRPKTCFLMMQLGHPMPPILQKIRTSLTGILAEQNIRVIDANSITTGHDFLNKIWKLIISVPMGIAIIHEDITIKTYGNIFYELGMMQAYGKETLVIKAKDIQMPSDFVRTEYVLYDGNFESHIRCFLDELKERADHYALMAEQLEKNPLLSIDYLKRAYLLTGERKLRTRALKFHATAGLENRAKDSIESIMTRF